MPRPTLNIIFLGLLCVFFISGVEPAALAQSGSDQKNAATWYEKAIEQFQRLSRDEWLLVMDYYPAESPTPELRAALSKIGPAFSAYQQGTLQEYSDFNLDFSQGIEMLAPHLGQMRSIARAMESDAMVRLHDGDSAGAAQRMAALLRSSAHFGDDGTIIGSLVGTAVCALGDRAVQQAMDRAAFGPAEAAVVLREVERLQSMSDPFNYIGAAAGDQELLVNWIDGVIDEPDAQDRITQMLGEAAFEDEDRPAHIEQIAIMNREEFESAVAQMDVMTDRVIGIMMMDDHEAAKTAMEELSAEIVAGEHGPLAILSSYWPKVLDRKHRADAMLETRAASLKEIVEEDVQPEEVANAAVWYRRAIEMIERFGPDELKLLRAFSAVHEVHADEDEHTTGRMLQPLLALSQDIVDVLREGSEKRRCDFSVIFVFGWNLGPSYAPGMRDAFRLIHADALRLLHLKRYEEAADRFAIGYRMLGHLSKDPEILSTLISHRALLESHVLLDAAMEAGAFRDEERSNVLFAFERVDAGDPCGYIASYRQLRGHLEANAANADKDSRRRAAQSASSSQGRPIQSEHVREELPSSLELVERADDEAALYYFVLMQYQGDPQMDPHDEMRARQAEEDERNRLASLHDVLDIDEVMEARGEGPEVAHRWRNGLGSIFHGYAVRKLNLLADRRSAVRADFRATSLLLRRPMLLDPGPVEQAQDE